MPRIEEPRHPPGEWIQAALDGIGVAVMIIDASERIVFLSPIAELLTGWPENEAVGRHVADIVRIENVDTRLPSVDPVFEVLRTGIALILSDHTIMIVRDGREFHIDHGSAPIRDAVGRIVGAVLIFCDVSTRQRLVQGVEVARAFAEGIVQTVHEPLVVLDSDLKVTTANQSFYRTFNVSPQETEGQEFLHLGTRAWDIPGLRELLEQILPRDSHFDNFKVDQEFEGLGRRCMILNARRLPPTGPGPALILLAIEDATDRIQAAEALLLSETRYRRLFETAQDGILLVDPDNRRIFDANPFLIDLLGYQTSEIVGKELWEIGLFRDIESNKEAFSALQNVGYIRYDNLPLRTHDDRGIEVEFVSNVYNVGSERVIQCNIRDVTDRKRAEDALRVAHAELEIRVADRTVELASANTSLKSEIGLREVAEEDRRELQQKLITVQEDERRSIARELHDQMGQHLAALGLGLKVVQDAMPHHSSQADQLQNLLSLTDQIGREIHQLALQLRPTALDDIGLLAALANYTEAWAERSGVEVDFHGYEPDAERLPAVLKTALYRVVQEALTNVLKHANARRTSVVLQRTVSQVTAVIEDDGQGFDSDSMTQHRLGILGMRERVALVGGQLTVESGLGRGTTVIARIPLSPKDVGERK
ncbi:hypothetical protein BH11PLA2_BH11PLA2_41040 [soil metagenome]